MDKYEFNIKVEQIKKLVSKSDYETAMKIADTIDWRRVRNVSILSMIATIYEKNEEYQEAKDILLLAFERAPIGKRLLYKLAELAIKEGNVGEAEDYYREFCDLASDDPRQYLLRYMILGAKGAPAEQLIHTLEQYCNVELDEKWLFELAILYNQAGMDDLCVLACDKIMLMFGLGKYVEKAMELKIQHAPLTKYQMDLEENRDKYEERLRAVEQEYEAPTQSFGFGAQEPGRPMPVRKPTLVKPEPAQSGEDVPVYGERQPYRPYRRPQEEESYEDQETYQDQEEESYYHGEPQYEEDAYYNGDSRYEDKGQYQDDGAYDDESYENTPYEEEQYAEESAYGRESSYDYQGGYSPQASYSDEETEDQYHQDGQDYEEDEEPYPGEDAYDQEEDYQAEDSRGDVVMEEDDQEEESQRWEMDQKPMTEEALAARVHEAEVQANLARELSRLSGAEFSEESRQAQTRVLKDIRSLKINGDVGDDTASPSSQVSNHLMIESEDPEEGLAMAVEALKQIHREMGIKNQAAKITGEKLNKKGVLALADKLTGKDLIIEYAGDMDDQTLQELDLLMSRDETGMNVVMIDNQEQLEAIHSEYPGLAKRFECIGEISDLKIPSGSEGEALSQPHTAQAQPNAAPKAAAVPPVQPKAAPISAGQPQPAPVTPLRPQLQPAPHLREPAPEHQVQRGPVLQRTVVQEPVYEEPRYQEEDYPETGYQQSEYDERTYDEPAYEDHYAPEDDYAAEDEYQEEPEYQEPKPAKKAKGRTKDKAARIPAAPAPDKVPVYRPEEEPEEQPADDEEEMDIDEFAQYACQYAGEIDCSISGKSMLALYERIEIMEEDGIALTRAAAEELIEDAADKAEKPSIGKRMKGLFSSKYDKDGLLILKEEHFI